MNTDFDTFMSQLRETNATLGFFCDFKKIANNVEDIAISLNMLNYLIGKADLRAAVEALWKRDKTVFDVMDILIATRKEQNKKYLDDMGKPHLIHELLASYEGVIKFLKETGMAEVLQNKDIKNLVDYVFGVEAGLDTHARKNRSGDITELLLDVNESIIVYIVFTRIIGLTIGSVIFQNVSHPDAPSMEQDS